MKVLKSYSLLILSFLMFLCFSLCIAINSVNVSVANASESSVPFRVEEGASIRLDNDANGTYGIAFNAYVGDTAKASPIENATYKMIILPSTLIDSYNSANTQDNIVKWLNDYATSKGGSLAVATCTPNADGFMKAAITDIYWVNLNRAFSAIAYYEVDGNIVEIADLAVDGRRSIIDVAQNAIDSGDYSEPQYADELEILQGFIADGEDQSNNIVISSVDESSLFSIIPTTYDVTGDIEAITDSEKGNAWKFTFNTKVNNDVHVELMYDNTLLSNRLKGYDTVNFSVYSPKSGTLYACKDAGFSNRVISKPLFNGWTDLSFSAKDIASAPYFIITYPELNSSYYITDFKAYTVSGAAEQVINLIDGLDFSDEYVMFYGNDITEARNAYNALSEKAKALVTNYSKLEEIEALYANYVVVADMSSKSGFAAYEGMGNSSWISTGYDETYQNYLSVSVPEGKDVNLALTFSTTDLATKLEGCEKVYFYVYSPCTYKDRELLLKINGSYNAAGTRPLLAKQSWTKVELSVEDFINLQVFGVYSGQNDGPCEYKFSQIYAVKSSLYAKDVIALINELPTNEDLIPFYGEKISVAREAYDNLSSSAQSAVTNYSKLQSIETTYQNVVVLADMSSKSGFAAYEGMGNSSWISTGYDETYQNYLSVSVPEGKDVNLALTFSTTDLATKLEGCEKVYFYVYSPCTYKDRELLLKINGSYNAAGTRPLLAKQAWTKVELSVEDFINLQVFGVYSGQNDGPCEYKFSQIYAVKASS